MSLSHSGDIPRSTKVRISCAPHKRQVGNDDTMYLPTLGRLPAMLAASRDGRYIGVLDDRSLASPGRDGAETGKSGRVSATACRSCRGSAGEVVLDLGDQP